MSAIFLTGGHSGLGLECAKHLVRAGCLDLILAARDVDRLQRAKIELQSLGPVSVHLIRMDVSSLASVRSGAAVCKDLIVTGKIPSLNAIICNAGAQFSGPISYSPDGIEETFAVNFLGHFLLVQLLLDQLEAHGRVVFTASGTHDPVSKDGMLVGAALPPIVEDLARQGTDGRKPASAGRRYTTSKLCVIMFAYELDRRLRNCGSTVASIAYDPGWIPETGLTRSVPRLARWLITTRPIKAAFKRAGITMGDLVFSSKAMAQLAMSPDYVNASGRYFQSSDGVLSERRSSAASYDVGDADKLWVDAAKLAALSVAEKSILV